MVIAWTNYFEFVKFNYFDDCLLIAIHDELWFGYDRFYSI